ncbi:hypothetical protein [Methylobacterium dankookense]|uniref:Uncharacterized protein n=1 Tax=Methylobacterium dankookense TaxID=560405 RepID=A0A564G8J7_9HYPH|nr:hypothetical protein [Methylobacterium dankookense]GJD59045.1 hypothetical protein IFDJLNFL_4971 [Methylobacterium dankookense]VUF15861.1 hypothetical protein MTDSW087_05609 [Methylobacterium dankookense]
MNQSAFIKLMIMTASTVFRRLTIGPVPKLFDATYYLRINRSAADSGIDPYLHYVRYGVAANLNPAEDFDTAFYRQQTGETRLDPLQHYNKIGAETGFDPSPNFNTTDYLMRYPDVATSKSNPLLHYRTHGRQEGREARSSASKFGTLVALEGVNPQYVFTLPDEVAVGFSIRVLRDLPVESRESRVPRLCFIFKFTQDEIDLLIDAFGAIQSGALSTISLDINSDIKRIKYTKTVLLSFECCYVKDEQTKYTKIFRYSELRLWDLRGYEAHLAEIYPAGSTEINIHA